MYDFSEQFKYLRAKNNDTQKDLAEQFNVTQSMISLWEKGKNYPEVPKLIEIAEYFGVTVDYLLGNPTDNYEMTQSEILTDTEKELLKEIRSLTSAQQSRVLGYIEGLKNKSAKRSVDNE